MSTENPDSLHDEHAADGGEIDPNLKVEGDYIPVLKVTAIIIVAFAVVFGSMVGVKLIFDFTVTKTIYDQRLSVPSERLKKNRARSENLLAGGVDPVTGKAGIPITDAMRLLVSQPDRINPIGKPPAMAPAEAAPTEAAPTEAAPTEAAPTEAAPTEAAPTEVAPTEAAPTEAAPTEAAPTEAAPTEAAPTEAAPTEAAPTEAAPTEAAPTEAAPPKAPPTGAAPAEKAPEGNPAAGGIEAPQ